MYCFVNYKQNGRHFINNALQKHDFEKYASRIPAAEAFNLIKNENTIVI